MNQLFRMLAQINKLAGAIEDESVRMVNDLRGHKEGNITHIYVMELSTEYKLENGKWVEVAPF